MFGVKYNHDPDGFLEICPDKLCELRFMWSLGLGIEKCHDLIRFTNFRFDMNSFGYAGDHVQCKSFVSQGRNHSNNV